MIATLIDKLELRRCLSEDEWSLLIDSRSAEFLDELSGRARAERDKRYGRDVFVRGLIEFTNHCSRDCLYCGLRRSNHALRRFRLSEDDILRCCGVGYDAGCRTFVLQGGEDPFYSDAKLVALVSRIKKRYPDCAVTLSVGERRRESYRALRMAGADRYLLRHETADPVHYAALHPTDASLDRRIECLNSLKSLGFQVGSGFMVGSPGQTSRHLARDMVFLEALKPSMVGIGPFISHRNTPFADKPNGTVELTLFLLACLRLMLPHALLPATTALNTLAGHAGYELGLNAGANVVMPNVSPLEHRGDYSLYEGKVCTGLESVEGMESLKLRLASAGYRLVVDRGDALPSFE